MTAVKAGDVVVVTRRQRLMDAWSWALSFMAGIGFSVGALLVVIYVTGVVVCR